MFECERKEGVNINLRETSSFNILITKVGDAKVILTWATSCIQLYFGGN